VSQLGTVLRWAIQCSTIDAGAVAIPTSAAMAATAVCSAATRAAGALMHHQDQAGLGLGALPLALRASSYWRTHGRAGARPAWIIRRCKAKPERMSGASKAE